MGPGASWEPFTIDQQEYDELWQVLGACPSKSRLGIVSSVDRMVIFRR